MFKKLALTAILATTTLGIAGSAMAGEGHWSIGKGVQCKIVKGVIVCGKTRP
jgi:hypothetical protein